MTSEKICDDMRASQEQVNLGMRLIQVMITDYKDRQSFFENRQLRILVCIPVCAIIEKIIQAFPRACIETFSLKEYESCIQAGTLDRTDKFDYIFMGRLIEKITDPKALVKNAFLLLSEQGKLFCAIGNIRHWSVWKEMESGRWRYGAGDILLEGICYFFTMHEMRKLFTESGYKALQIVHLQEKAPENIYRQLKNIGMQAVDRDLDTLFWLLAACKSEYMSPIVEVYPLKLRWDLVFLLRRIENGIEVQKNCQALWMLCEGNNVDGDYLLTFIRQAVLHPDRVLERLAQEIECEKHG